MFTDSVKMKLSAGKGGNGTIAWRREKYIPKGGPYGGNGGNGGSIIIKSDPQVFSLDEYRNRRLVSTENGRPGGANNRHGRNGKDLIIKVPCGTLILDAETGGLLYELTKPEEAFLICSGGRGGKGNTFFKTSTNQAPAKATPGKEGDVKDVRFELKLIVDVGFMGFPNAGKSTLLSKLAAIEVKTGAYPFTTLKPNLSYIEFDDFSRVYLADIPGIIPDAHNDRGLGLSFLKHVERSSTLIYIIDISGEEGRDPFRDFQILRDEAKAYSPAILNKPFLVALNKVDKESNENLQAFKEKYPFDPETLFEISALEEKGLAPFIEKMRFLAQANGKKYH
ncbi:MAG: Obg family GTPase CgtA [Candidatus Neptunochlamydia sp.]|nr:Obg family GTPase CgtA [Candidatus Neptunochlamydia sp.]